MVDACPPRWCSQLNPASLESMFVDLAIVMHDRPQMQDCIREKLVDMVIGGFIYRIMALMYLARCSESLSVHVDAHI